MGAMKRLQTLSDEDLVARLESLCRVERTVGTEIVAHLMEVKRRRLDLDLGYSSLYSYCVERLGFSSDVAYKRMQAAEVAQAYPEVLGHLESGALTLSSLAVVVPHLEEHGKGLIEQALGKSKREVQRLVAELLVPAPNSDPATLEPVAGGRMRLQVVLDEEACAALEQAISLDRHLDPHGDIGQLLGRALGQYVKTRRKARLAESTRPRAPSQAPRGRHIPAEVRRQVAERDGEQCAWVGADGHRCTEAAFLEFDHIRPKALGGSGATAEQVRLLCHRHNQRAAEKSYGVRFMNDAKTRARCDDTIAADVRRALVTLGYSKKEAAQSVKEALEHAPVPTSLESLMRRALRCAPA